MFMRLRGADYAVWFVAALLIAAASVFLYPQLLRTIVLGITDGQCSGGACGAVALVVSVGLKPLLVLIMLAVFIVPAFNRIRGSFSRLWTFLPISLAIGSSFFLYAMGNFWAANFAAGVLTVQFPMPLAALCAFGVLFSIQIEDRRNYPGSLVDLTGPFSLPVGKIYAFTAIWCSVAILGFLSLRTILPFMVMSEGGGRALIMMFFQLAAMPPFSWLFNSNVAATANILAAILMLVSLFYRGPKSSVSSPRTLPQSPSADAIQTTALDEPMVFGRRRSSP